MGDEKQQAAGQTPAGHPGGRSNFEGHRLNTLIDLVDVTDPADLQNAGDALWDAQKAIGLAAQELADHIDLVDWEGEAGTAFRTWGRNLVKHAEALGDFADAAATQIALAGTGLASVRSAMPPRDDRAEPLGVDELPVAKRVDGNPEYAAALKVEKDRQEAINQINRLASFYEVSAQTLAAQEPPVFTEMPSVGVPPARDSVTADDAAGGSGGTAGATGAGGFVAASTASVAGGHADASGPPHRSGGVAGPAGSPGTSMEIDSVATPPTMPSAPVPDPPVTTTTGSGGATLPSVPPGPVSPVRGQEGRFVASPGETKNVGPRPVSVGGPGVTGAAGAVGSRPPLTGQGGTQALPGGASTSANPGIQGGRPGVPSTSTGPYAGRATGIVGGTPQRPTTGTAGPPRSRGAVVGGQGTATGRGTVGPNGHPGVVGASPVNGMARSVGGGTPSVNGVVGTPRGSASESRLASGAFRGQADRGENEESDSVHPDYSMDEAAWAVSRKNVVPPVIQ